MDSEDKAVNIKREENNNLTTNSALDDEQNKQEEMEETKEDVIRLSNIEHDKKQNVQADIKVDLDDQLCNSKAETSNNKTSNNKTSNQNENDLLSADHDVENTNSNENRNEASVDELDKNNGETYVNKLVFELPDLEVPISERRLSPETIDLLNKPVDNKLNMSGIDFQFSKVIGVILKSKGLEYSEDFLVQMNDLSIIYFHDIIETLRKFTEIQRRKRPSISDVELLMRMKGIKPAGLYKEFVKTKEIEKKYKKEIDVIDKQTKELINKLNEKENLDENDPSLPFFTNEQYEITELIPKQSSKPIYIPSFLPDLPPDYTYQKTPKYMDMITDLKQLRLKLVEESRLTEKSLYNLIDDDEKKWKEDFETQIRVSLLEVDDDVNSGNEDSIMSEADQMNRTDVETPVPDHGHVLDKQETKLSQIKMDAMDGADGNAESMKESLQKPSIENQSIQTVTEKSKQQTDVKAFDVVTYSKKRREIQHKKELEIDHKRHQRESNIFFKAEKYFSPYGTLPVTHEIDMYFANIVQDEFKSVIRSVRTSEKKKKRKVEKILREKAQQEQEKEKEREKMGLGFSFGPINHMLDDDNDDSDKDEDLGFPTFDFGDSNQPQNNQDAAPSIENNGYTDENETNIVSITETNENSSTPANAGQEMDSDSFEAELEEAIQADSAPKKTLLENSMNVPDNILSDFSDDEVELEDV